MPRSLTLSRWLLLLAVVTLAGCAVAKPRTDDPLEKFNRKAYKFNDVLSKKVIRPVAMGYRKITNEPVRKSVDNLFTNLRLPITIANDLLQARFKQAAQASGRFVVNVLIGIGGLYDRASEMGMPLQENDFGITLAHWGLPEGDFLMVPLLGPKTTRDLVSLPVDGYLFDPLSYLERNTSFKAGQYYVPEAVYLVSVYSSAIDAENFLNSAFDPYAFMRDAYRQNRIYAIYYGNPPNQVIEQMQGLDDKNFDPDQLLDQQHQWENKHPSPTDASKPQ